MGMFDFCRPKDEHHCPLCGGLIIDWQGKDGEVKNAFLYVEGHKHPFLKTSGGDSDYSTVANMQLNTLREIVDLELPETFFIYGECAQCGAVWNAKCLTEDGVWVQTILVTESNVDELVPPSDPYREGTLMELREINQRCYQAYLASKSKEGQ